VTNIVAAILMTVVTNVVWTDNSSSYGQNYIFTPTTTDLTFHESHSLNLDYQGGTIYYGNQSEPTEKTKTVTVVEVWTIKFKWRGKEWTGKDKRVISTTATKYRKKEEWEPVE